MCAKFHLIDLITVLTQAKQLGLHVPRVPNRHAFIATACDHEILIKGRVIDGHDLRDMRIDGLCWTALPHVPDLELLIIAD